MTTLDEFAIVVRRYCAWADNILSVASARAEMLLLRELLAVLYAHALSLPQVDCEGVDHVLSHEDYERMFTRFGCEIWWIRLFNGSERSLRTKVLSEDPRVLGGEYGGDILGTISSDELISASGHIAQQIADVPDGTSVALSVTDQRLPPHRQGPQWGGSRHGCGGPTGDASLGRDRQCLPCAGRMR